MFKALKESWKAGLSSILGNEVSIESIRGGFSGLDPWVSLEGLSISTPGKEGAIFVSKANAELNFSDTVLNFSPIPNYLEIGQIYVGIHFHEDGSMSLEGGKGGLQIDLISLLDTLFWFQKSDSTKFNSFRD